MNKLSDLQHDALLEIFNIGVGNAAKSMSLLIRDEVKLSAPKLQIVTENCEPAVTEFMQHNRVCAVSQDFSGTLNARAFLVFPEGKTHDIVHRMIGDQLTAEDLNAMEEEALSEIGNIILNACIGAMSDMLHTEFSSSLPSYHLGSVPDVFAGDCGAAGKFMLFLHIDFSMPQENINGYLFFLLNLQSFKELTQKIDLFLAQI